MVRTPLLRKLVVDLCALHTVDETLPLLQTQGVLHLLPLLYLAETVLVGMVDDVDLLLELGRPPP